MLFDEVQRFLLDIVMRVCPCVECKHLHILYGYIPAVEREREREGIVTEKQLLQHSLCTLLLIYVLSDVMGYRKRPCQSSKHCKLLCKRSSAVT